MQPLIHDRAVELIDAFIADGQADLVAQLIFPLPAMTIFGMIGFPTGDLEKIKIWCWDKLEVNWGRPSLERQQRSADNMIAFWEYCRDFVERRALEPAEDLTSAMLRTSATDPEGLTHTEIASIVFALGFAGHETTTNLITNAVRQLLSRPGLWDELCAEPGLVPGAVEETLRHDSSVIAWRRITTRPVEIGGVSLPEGARLMVGLGAANHDPTRFPDPDTFDPRRTDARAHVSFGKGIHFCLGQHLSRLEARIVLELLAARLPGLRLAAGQELEFPPNISFRGPKSLQVEWEVD